MTLKVGTVSSLILFAAAVNADYYTAATGVVGTNMLDPHATVGSDYGVKTSSSIDISASESLSVPGYSDSGTAHFQVSTEMGRIHAQAQMFATHSYENEPPGLGGGISFLQVNANDFTEYHAHVPGSPFAGGYWEDQLHIRSSTLSVGTPVQFLLHMTLDGTVSKNAPLTDNPTGATLTTNFGTDFLELKLQDGANALSVDKLVTAYVGDDTFFQSTLKMYAQTSYTKDGSAAYANVDAWNTGKFTFESLTPGVTYTTDSGYRYQPVPEPASMAVLGLGAFGILRRRRRG